VILREIDPGSAGDLITTSPAHRADNRNLMARARRIAPERPVEAPLGENFWRQPQKFLRAKKRLCYDALRLKAAPTFRCFPK
jgi:hypothetical protein